MTQIPQFLERYSYDDLKAILKHFGIEQEKGMGRDRSSLLDWEDGELLMALEQMLFLAALLAHNALNMSSKDFRITIEGQVVGNLCQEDFAWLNEWGGEPIPSVITCFDLHGLKPLLMRYELPTFQKMKKTQITLIPQRASDIKKNTDYTDSTEV